MSERKDKTINQAQYEAEYIPENSVKLNTITFVSSIPKNPSSRQLRRKSRYHCVEKGNPQVSSEREENKKSSCHACHEKRKRPTNQVNRSLPFLDFLPAVLSLPFPGSFPCRNVCRVKLGGRMYHFELRSKKHLLMLWSVHCAFVCRRHVHFPPHTSRCI
jgi:hypothetical protein